MTSSHRLLLAAASLLASAHAHALLTPMPVDEPGMLALFGGAGAVVAILVWRNKRKK